MKTMSKNSSGMKMADSNKLAQAFSDTSAKNDSGVWLNVWHYDKSLEFHTFYHPFSGRHTRRHDQYGMEGLMETV
jgi:hypothetical protein